MKIVREKGVEGKVIVCTGAAGVLCSSMTEDLLRHGAKVAVLDLRKDVAERFVKSLQKKGLKDCIAVEANVLDKDSLEAAKKVVLKKWRRIDVLINGADVKSAVVATRYGDVLPSSKALAGAGIELIAMERREFLLRNALEQVAENYDYIFIDCPPSLELLTLNALCAADSILVPVQGEYYALEGLSDLMNTVRIVRRSLNPRLELEGVLLTMFDGRTNLALQVAEEVKHYFPGKVYATVIPRNVRLSEAPSHGKPITAYDRTSRGAEAYTAFAAEFLKKNS